MPENRRANRLTISEPETHHFPDDLSNFPMNHFSDYSYLPDPLVSPDPSSNAPHPSLYVANCSVPDFQQLFQIPS
jgi:hypothetical protein